MADFIAVTACNDPKIKDHEAVEKIIARYYVEPDLNVGVGFDEKDGSAFVFVYGYVWPDAWPIPDGIKPEEFDPYVDDDTYEGGADGFRQLLKDLAPYLIDPMTVQAVGSIKFRFPLSACEWHIPPRGKKVQLNEFSHSSQPVPV